MNTITTLAQLLEAMRVNDPRTLDRHGQWRSDLPTFGDMPEWDWSVDGVWSWDNTRMLVGTCADDFEIVARTDQESAT